ncbi:MAG: DUF5362 family protein [bacterium]
MEHIEQNSTLEKALFYPQLDKLASDMKFISIVSIIFAAIASIAIVTVPVTILQIIAAIKLRNAADDIKKYIKEEDFAHMKEAWLSIGKYMNIVKILLIINIVLFVVCMIACFFSCRFMGPGMMGPGMMMHCM